MSDEPASNDLPPNDAPAADAPAGAVAVADAPDLDLGYQVAIEAFSGPLDLLLYLVRRAQVDIADIPIALIADQFIATVGAWQDLDLDVAGDFILMAATLLEIKSRLVTPPREGEEGDEDDPDEEVFDPRAELIQQLLAFRRFKDAPLELARLEAEQLERCPRQLRESIPEDAEEAETWSLDNADPYLLFKTWEQVMAKIAGLGPRRVVYDDVPMEERMGALIQTMAATREARLSWLMERMPTPIAKVGMLVALLECTRQRYVETIQHEQYGEVFLRFRDEAERNAQPVLPPEPVDEPAKKRRRRLPLITFVAPKRADEPEGDADDAAPVEEEEVVETDEQRFVRELNESCRLDAVLERGADLEAGLAAFMIEKKARDEAAAIAKAEAEEFAKAEAAAEAERQRLAAEERERRKAEAAAARRAERERRKAERDAAKAAGDAASAMGDAPVATQEPADEASPVATQQPADDAAPSDGGPRAVGPDGDSRAGQPL